MQTEAEQPIFRFCMATLQAGNVDITTFPISAELIRTRRMDFNSRVAEEIKVIYRTFVHKGLYSIVKVD